MPQKAQIAIIDSFPLKICTNAKIGLTVKT